MLYRFCFLDAHDRTAASEEIEVASLLDAIARVHMLLKQSPHQETVEVWLGEIKPPRRGCAPLALGRIMQHRVGALRQVGRQGNTALSV